MENSKYRYNWVKIFKTSTKIKNKPQNDVSKNESFIVLKIKLTYLT